MFVQRLFMNYNISIFLDKRRSKANGQYPVKLRVYSSTIQKKKLYPVGIDLIEKDFEHIWESKKRLRGKNEELRIELQEIETRANVEAKKLSHFSFEEFEKKMFRKSTDGDNVFFHFQRAIDRHTKRKKIGTAVSYRYAMKAVKNFITFKTGKEPDRFSFAFITPSWLEEFEEYMLDKGRSVTTIGIYGRTLKAVFNAAILDKDISEDVYPFGKKKYSIPKTNKVKKALTSEQLAILFNARSRIPEQEKARNFWFFSYACNGMNIKDISLLKYSDFDNDQFSYYRSKTFKTSTQRTKIKIYLNEFTKRVIKKYGNTSKEGYVFPVLEIGLSEKEIYQRIQNFTRLINQHVKNLAKENGLPKEISTYWARHSFATNAVRNGASMEFISEALNHSNLNVTKGYFAGFEDETKKEFAKKLMNF